MASALVDGMRPLELGSPGPMRADLNALVLAGQKVACFGLMAEYRDEGEALEHVGERMALVDDHGARIATIEVTEVRELALGQVTWAEVEAEGEGFADIAAWRQGHEDFWRTEGRTVTDATELGWVRFRVVVPRPLLPPRPTAGDLGLPEGYEHVYGGKVRDLFRTPTGDLLVVASDRISAYDWVLPTPIPDKGRILTQMSLWWFDHLSDLVANHIVSADVPGSAGGRAVVCRNLEMLPVECVVRGYLTGSGLSDYRATGSICGVELPGGLVDGSRLPEPIFTPATKAAIGDHDENVAFDHVVGVVGADLATQLRDTSIEIYTRAEATARERGIILADTKFEFGLADGQLILADEVLTPDSSRYWPADQWQPGQAQPSFDKQFVRDWLASPASGWDRAGSDPPPALPDEIVEQTRGKYIEAFERVTGTPFAS